MYHHMKSMDYIPRFKYNMHPHAYNFLNNIYINYYLFYQSINKMQYTLFISVFTAVSCN